MLTYNDLRRKGTADRRGGPDAGLLFRWLPDEFEEPNQAVIMVGTDFFVRLLLPGSTWNARPFRSLSIRNPLRSDFAAGLADRTLALEPDDFSMEIVAPRIQPGYGALFCHYMVPTDHVFMCTYSGMLQISGVATGLTQEGTVDDLRSWMRRGAYTPVEEGTTVRIRQNVDAARRERARAGI